MLGRICLPTTRSMNILENKYTLASNRDKKITLSLPFPTLPFVMNLALKMHTFRAVCLYLFYSSVLCDPWHTKISHVYDLKQKKVREECRQSTGGQQKIIHENLCCGVRIMWENEDENMFIRDKKLNVHNNHYKSDIFIKYYYAWYLTVLSHFRRYIHDRLTIQEFVGLGEYIKIQAEVNLIHSLLKSAGLHNTTQFFVVPTICQPLAVIQSQDTSFSVYPLGALVTRTHFI